MKRYLTFDDVALVPRYSDLESRGEPELQSWLTVGCDLAVPFVAAPMQDVMSSALAKVLYEHDIPPIFPRLDVPAMESLVKENEDCFISWGTKNIEDLIRLIDEDLEVMPIGVCFDVAHGHSKGIERAMTALRKAFGDKLEIIAGSVCTPEATQDLINWGATGVRCGIGNGSACTTRMTTGFGTPQFTTIQECAEIAHRFKVPLIADGGIRDSRDIALCLAAGASSVMLGRLFAETTESASAQTGLYRGQASRAFQRDGVAAEGVEIPIKANRSASDLLEELTLNLKSAFSYAGARDLEEFQRHARFVEVTSSYMAESRPRY